ncbi:hypothetical protein V5O48_011408 [Marasmius crinis-equi]|uniref:Uncharacterized protein n=1 Tax=Marasmius crinis-equi TaxID=585013 RepID=A0ABR3F5P1_9AGAR
MTTDSEESFLNWTEVSGVLQVMSEDLLNSAAAKGTCFLIGDGERIEEPADAVMAETTVEPDADGEYYFNCRGSRLEVGVVLQLRNRWPTANSPTGSAVLKEWKDADSDSDSRVVPREVAIHPLPESRGYKSWVKRTTFDGLKWEELLFEAHFRGADEGKSGEYTVSGDPVAGAKMFEMFRQMDEKFSEGRGSEYVDPFGILKIVGTQAGVRNNRVPEVTVRNHVDDVEQAMSFHQIHRLKRSETVFSVTVIPRAFLKQCKDDSSKKCLGWGFRLVNLRVLGKRETPKPKSPEKSVKIRKLHNTDFEERAGTSKKARKGGSGTKS